MLKKKISRRVTRIETRRQVSLELFEGDPALEQPTVPVRCTAIRFEDPDPREIRFGVQRLDEHLRAMGLRDALVLRQMLVDLDWSDFEARYSPVGRPGYAPWLMAGVVLFGLMRGVSSLRELERFTRSDLECMWVGGGITPDHSILGRFIVRHEQELNGPLFESITQAVLRRTDSGRERLAGDGTVLEAMSSRFALIKREALEAQRAQLREQAESKPEQADEQTALAQIERACEALAERPSAKAVVVHEPEAGLLKLKNGRGSRPAYQVTVLANSARVVVDAQVHSTSEQASLADQLERLDGAQTREVLLDAGFNTYTILESTLAKEISLLCPEQAEHVREDERTGVIPLRQFRYVEDGDYYLCPAEQQLHPCRRYAGNPETGQRAYVQYATPACGECERRAQCTRGTQRTIQRSAGQELKEAMRLVMAQVKARQVFAQRKQMVEPVFSTLRERQGLNRFRRRGLSGVRLEFRLHLMAYNLGRALAYARRGLWGHFVALCRLIRALYRQLSVEPSIFRDPVRTAPADRSFASERLAA
jgi:transposase